MKYDLENSMQIQNLNLQTNRLTDDSENWVLKFERKLLDTHEGNL